MDNISKLLFEKKQLKGLIQFYSSQIESNCFAYGASRKAGDTSFTESNEESAFITLFDETALLINPEEWILQADYALKRKSKSKKAERELEIIKDIISHY